MNKSNDYDKFAKMRQESIVKGVYKPHVYVEKPMMKKIIPNLKDKKVLLLGCGTGEESIFIEENGAKEIIGIDVSKESINIANKTYSKHKFYTGDMHKTDFEDNEFDFIYSSLAIHYSENPETVIKEINRILKPNGQLQLSLAHPVRWGISDVEIDNIPTKIIGFTEDKNNPRIYGSYSSYKKQKHDFKTGERLEFYTASPSFYFNLLKDNGFIIEEFQESKVIDECKEVDINYYNRFNEFPQFMAFLASKK